MQRIDHRQEGEGPASGRDAEWRSVGHGGPTRLTQKRFGASMPFFLDQFVLADWLFERLIFFTRTRPIA
jgi:hypothetical protein